jgi:hypothetical protein
MISTMVPSAHNTASFVRSAAMRRITPKAIIGLVTFLAATGRPSGEHERALWSSRLVLLLVITRLRVGANVGG